MIEIVAEKMQEQIDAEKYERDESERVENCVFGFAGCPKPETFTKKCIQEKQS